MISEDARRRSMRLDDDDKPRKLPQAEKSVRINAIRAELVGLDITGDLEPSDNVVDRFVDMQEQGVLKYLRWEEIGRRDAEVRGAQKDNFWTIANGQLVSNSTIVELPADVSTDLKMKTMLQRRGVALQMARLMSFKHHEVWVSRLFKEYNRDPLPGYAKFSLAQMIRVDQELFAELAELTRGGLGLGDDGSLPLDSLLPALLASTRIGCLFNPLPQTGASRAADPPRFLGEVPKVDKGEKRKRQQEKAERRKVQQLNVAHPKGKGKGKGKGDKNPKSSMPGELIGLNPSHKGKPICFGFNLDGCSNAVKNDACIKGLHLCMKCGDAHSQRGCTKHGF
jgi:hypothetical protein